jgi:cation diffusion facilitator family transporter
MNTRAGWYSVLINVFLFGLNLAMAAYSHSLALQADTAHNLLDLVASLSVVVGLAFSQRKNRAFPYGLYKLENVVSVLIAFGMFLTGYEIAREALISTAQAPEVRPVMLAGVGVAILVPALFSRYELRLGGSLNSPSLIADALEFRAHILSSSIVFVALAGQLVGISLDHIAALVIVLWIACVGWRTLVDGMRVLLDASLDETTLNAVRAIITAHAGVDSIKTLTGRNSGRFRFIEAEITLRVSDLVSAHWITTELEDAIRSEVPHVERVLIHTEPVRRENLRVAIPLATTNGVLAPGFGAAPYFAICEVRARDRTLLSKEVLPTPQTGFEKGRGLRVAEWLVKQRVDLLLAREDLNGKAPLYAFRSTGVDIKQTTANNLQDAIVGIHEPDQKEIP